MSIDFLYKFSVTHSVFSIQVCVSVAHFSINFVIGQKTHEIFATLIRFFFTKPHSAFFSIKELKAAVGVDITLVASFHVQAAPASTHFITSSDHLNIVLTVGIAESFI